MTEWFQLVLSDKHFPDQRWHSRQFASREAAQDTQARIRRFPETLRARVLYMIRVKLKDAPR